MLTRHLTGIPHAATAEIDYEGYRIPEGAILVPNIPSLSRSREIFEQPDTFEPARFIETTTASGECLGTKRGTSFVQKNFIRDHFHYGFGRRACPGAHIAEDSLFITISRILWAFDICALPGNDLNMESQRGQLLLKEPC